jgi:hypothetical protein
MIRVIIGIIIELFATLQIIGMVIGSYKKVDPLGLTIAGSIFVLLVIVIGGLLIYSGKNTLTKREAVLNIALRTFREKGCIDYVKIIDELNVNEVRVRKYILWGYRKNFFFKISSNGIEQVDIEVLNK